MDLQDRRIRGRSHTKAPHSKVHKNHGSGNSRCAVKYTIIITLPNINYSKTSNNLTIFYTTYTVWSTINDINTKITSNQTTGKIYLPTIPTQAIPVSPWLFSHSMTAWGLVSGRCRCAGIVQTTKTQVQINNNTSSKQQKLKLKQCKRKFKQCTCKYNWK